MRVSRHLLCSSLAFAVLAAACSHAPEPRQEQADIAGIGPRPKVFGRHAWDEAQKRAAERMAASSSSPAPAVVAQAPAAPAPAAPPPATPKPAAPKVAASAPAPAVETPKPPKPAKPAQLADAPAKKGPNLWQRVIAPPPPEPVIVGGYGPATDKAAVEAAAAFAVHESPGYVLKGVDSARVQVVAGMNYSLCLWVRRPTLEPNPLHRRLVAATVFQGLDGHRELTAWKEVATCHAGATAP